MGQLASVCVFCGSSPGGDPAYRAAAEALGRAIANRGQRLVYGGAKVGLMGAIADAALDAGGEVIGILPAALADKEIAHNGLSRLEIVASMHERKARMAELSDGFIALPGGVGTLEEIFEIWTWGQLGFHAKPSGFLNALGYYNALRNFVDHAVGEAFLKAPHRDMMIFREDAGQMLDAMDAYVPPVVEKWIGRPEL
ncbi:TIGR00730 family Rossman fold protein [Phenylobacterium sp.]|uniref:LOG family protein n=1 Tax=Phenylobacterium sp. TaxID=1871053 RepID=UPI0027361A4F|nr:TIGR00730 family Rossman fold protein [Phenylobacterium sp.]MDP3853947.1 TIGR00730 family Rossman fold protein [Phenylobacterium sp.]